MKKRSSMSKKSSKKMFSKGASKTHRLNVHSGSGYMMRGGIRL